MKPILLVSGDFVKTGGMDRANYALAKYLAERGHPVHLVGFRAGSDLTRRPNLTLHRVPKPLGSYLLGQPLLDYAGRARARRIAGQGGRVVVNGGNCRWGDVNWLHHLNILDLPLTSGGRARRAKRAFVHRLYVHDEREALIRARIIITTCERNKNDLIDWLGLPADRVHVAYLGTDPEVFHPATPDERAALRGRLGWSLDQPLFAFVGALGDLRKGFDTLFTAWSALCRDSSWSARLVVVASGAEVPVWQARTEAAGLADRIAFLGFRRDLPELMRACDAHVLPSRYEGYSLVTQEALCCGIPAFVTRTAGIAERYPAELTDWLIPDPNDAADLTQRLRNWQARAEQTAPALAAFSEELRANTWDRMAERFTLLAGEALALSDA